ncbi:MAG TPA: hypothetical protein VMV35_04410 [Halothiobacillus sp.]|nr:hypothetical protein [Halothiobacillus sp.]
MPHYQRIAIETFLNLGELSSKKIRARPLPGQGYPADMRVECSSRMRDAHPIGTVFIVQAQLKQKVGEKPFLYTSWQWKYEVVDKAIAKGKIESGSL